MSPKSLAPDSRYRKRFHIYLFWLLTAYLALCIIGPKVLAIPGLSIPEAWRDPTLWPMGAASALMTVGITGDNKFPGNIENFIRRKAHEAAYIPTAVTTLSYQLASFGLDEWLRTADRQTIEKIQTQSGGAVVGSIPQIAALAEGKLVSWIRGNILIYCLRGLSEEKYDAIKAQDENKDATRFLEALHDSIKSRLAAPTPDHSIDARLAKDMDDFVDGASVLLASTLLQATPDARGLSSTITKLGFKEIGSSSPQTWMQFAILSTAMLCAASFLTWLIAYLLPGLVFGIASRLVPALKGLDRQAALPRSLYYCFPMPMCLASDPFLCSICLYRLLLQCFLYCICAAQQEQGMSRGPWFGTCSGLEHGLMRSSR